VGRAEKAAGVLRVRMQAPFSRFGVPIENVVCLIKRILRKFADSSNRSEKVEKAVWLAAHIGMFPIEVFFPLSANLRKFHMMAR
jgi:hypothetical protein